MAWSTAGRQYAPRANCRAGARTSRLVEVREVRQVVAGLEHGRVHQWGQVRVLARLDGLECRLDGFFLRGASSAAIHHGALRGLSAAYLAILELEDQLDLVAGNLLVDYLRGDPALGGVGLPCPRARLENVRHVGCRRSRSSTVVLSRQMSGSNPLASQAGLNSRIPRGRGLWRQRASRCLHCEGSIAGGEGCGAGRGRGNIGRWRSSQTCGGQLSTCANITPPTAQARDQSTAMSLWAPHRHPSVLHTNHTNVMPCSSPSTSPIRLKHVCFDSSHSIQSSQRDSRYLVHRHRHGSSQTSE
jgi:hypothetical protein